MKKIILSLFIILVTVNTSCQETTKLPDRFTNSLLYVESKDEEGIGAGGFSEIVVFDLNTNTIYHLTNDSYYDRYPSYSSLTNTVTFESKRFSDPDIVGLTADSKIFTFNLTDKSLKSLDLYKGPGENGLDQQFLPILSNDGSKICYTQYVGNLPQPYYLFIYDFRNDSVDLLQKDLRMPIRYIWSEQDNRIVYSVFGKRLMKNKDEDIYMIDVLEKSSQQVIKKDSTQNTIGDIKQNKILYVSRNSSYASDHYIKILDVSTRNELFSSNMHEFGFKEIKSPVFEGNDIIYFIGNPTQFEGATGDDIYRMNLLTKKIERVSYTELMKVDLSFIK
jgi:Tol biopolymer transport system component